MSQTRPLTDVQLAHDDHGPHWTAINHAENLISQFGDILTTVQRLHEQNEARGRELQRLREQAETARVRLWLIEQVLQRVDASQDPAGIAGDLGPYLDGLLHPDHIAAYHAAQEA